MIYSINFLRFVAAFAVVLSHTANVLGLNKTITIGDVGVDIFFLISGFVIGIAAQNESSASGFLIRRLVRVLPIYWLALLFHIAFLYWQWGVIPSGPDLWHSFSLVPSNDGNGYILQQAWTLTYELIFYGVFAVAIAVSAPRSLAFTCVVILILSTMPIPALRGYLMLEIMIEFVVGLLLFHCIGNKVDIGKKWGCCCIVVGVILLGANATGPSFRPIHWGIPSAMIFFGFLALEQLSIFRNKFLILLGASSYSIYLTHITIMVIAREKVLEFTGLVLADYPILSRASLAILAVVVGVAIHHWIEAPILRRLRRMVRPKIPIHALAVS